MTDDKRLHVKAAVATKLGLVADLIGVTPPALIAFMLDEYVRARPDISTALNEVKPTSVATKPKAKVEEYPAWMLAGLPGPAAPPASGRGEWDDDDEWAD